MKKFLSDSDISELNDIQKIKFTEATNHVNKVFDELRQLLKEFDAK
jgi:hypothetical protein